jgi:hypothetical protein
VAGAGGEETDRRWEQGEDLSFVEFTSFEYQQSKQVVAGEDIKNVILKSGIRKVERCTGVSHHGEPVRRKTLAKIVKLRHSSLTKSSKSPISE